MSVNKTGGFDAENLINQVSLLKEISEVHNKEKPIVKAAIKKLAEFLQEAKDNAATLTPYHIKVLREASTAMAGIADKNRGIWSRIFHTSYKERIEKDFSPLETEVKRVDRLKTLLPSLHAYVTSFSDNKWHTSSYRAFQSAIKKIEENLNTVSSENIGNLEKIIADLPKTEAENDSRGSDVQISKKRPLTKDVVNSTTTNELIKKLIENLNNSKKTEEQPKKVDTTKEVSTTKTKTTKRRRHYRPFGM